MAYYNVEPFGHKVHYGLLADIASILYNAFKGKGARTMRPSDFYGTMELREQQSPEEIKAVMMQLVKDTAPKEGKQRMRKAKRKKNG